MKTLHISAGGQSERIADYISTIRPFMPKHLLPIPTEGKTLLGEVIIQAQDNFDQINVWASTQTYPHIALALEQFVAVRVNVDGEMTGPLGPMIRAILSTNSRTYGCAGDFFCRFSWSEFERFHEEHKKPISILVAESIPAPKGARFHSENNIITTWERVERTTADDRINIGCYIVDPVPEVIELLKHLGAHKEDAFFDTFVPQKLVVGYDPGSTGFNVNVVEVYKRLLQSLA